jgi:8-oxo-dGTP diphosphatase
MSPIQVTCAIIVKEDKILAAQRSETMSLPLKWEFPGGKLIPGESEEECLKREIQEELNISITIKSKLTTSIHDYDNFTIALIPFLVEYKSGEISLQEHRQIGWYTKEELTILDWAPADIPILNELLSNGNLAYKDAKS